MNWSNLHWRNQAQFSSHTLTRRTARPLTQTTTVHLEYDLQGLTCYAVLLGLDLDYICTWRSLSATRSLCWSHWKPASSLHRPPTTGPSHFTQPFVSDTVLWGWPHLDLWGHRGQTARDFRVLDLLFTSSWQPQWRHRDRLRQQQFTDEVDGWWWRHYVFMYSCVESDVFLHTEWLHHLNCLLWVASCHLSSFLFLFIKSK